MTDVTAAYRRAFEDSKRTADLARERLAGKKVLLVRGFLSDAVMKIGDALRTIAGSSATLPIGQYFDDQMRWLAEIGVPHERVQIESEAGIRRNGPRIAARLAASEPAVIISHSKGCLDVLEALVSDPALWPRVSLWIAIQGPFGGTPVADTVIGNRIFRGVADLALRAAGGEIASLEEMRQSSRAEYHEQHREVIARLLETVPTLCFASHLTRAQLRTTFLVPTVELIGAKFGLPNDGLVPATAAQLEGARVVAIDGVDHAMPVMPSLGDFDRIRFTTALLAVA